MPSTNSRNEISLASCVFWVLCGSVGVWLVDFGFYVFRAGPWPDAAYLQRQCPVVMAFGAKWVLALSPEWRDAFRLAMIALSFWAGINVLYLILRTLQWIGNGINAKFGGRQHSHNAPPVSSAAISSSSAVLKAGASDHSAPTLAINKPAMIGFCLSLLAAVLYEIGIIPIAALIFSAVGVAKADSRVYRNGWMAYAGLILGILYTLMYMRAHGHIRL